MASDFVQKILNKLFNRSHPEQPSTEIVREPLVRSRKFIRDYEEWRSSPEPEIILDCLARLYRETKNAESFHPGFQIYDTPQAKGLYFNVMTEVKDEHLPYLADSFRDVCLNEGYLLYMSDRRYSESDGKITSVERHYLKPDHVKSGTTFGNPLYGNVSIEVVARDGVPEHLKLLVTRYAGRGFSSPQSFDELVEKLFLR